MKKITIAAAAGLVVASASVAFTDDGPRRIREFLTGFEEAPTVVATTGNGTFRAEISHDEQEIRYRLTFNDLEGDVSQAHIHIGPDQVAGPVVLWLCQATARDTVNPTTPECTESNPLDTRNGSVDGVLTAAQIRPQPANGVEPGDFADVVRLIRAGKTYVNVHSSKYGPGEIRSQISRGDERGGHSGH